MLGRIKKNLSDQVEWLAKTLIKVDAGEANSKEVAWCSSYFVVISMVIYIPLLWVVIRMIEYRDGTKSVFLPSVDNAILNEGVGIHNIVI